MDHARDSVALVQVCNVFGDGIYLPLAAGMLRAYARLQPDLAASYDFAPIIAERLDLDEACSRLAGARIVAFSTYVWNWEYSLALSRLLAQRAPDVVRVAGGPQIPADARPLVESGAFDALVHGEGEVTFAELLRALRDGRPLSEVEGVTARDASSQVCVAPRRARLDDLDVLPSPFIEGDFADLLSGPRRPIGLWETNRGCPFSCSFCYWGSAVGQKVRVFGWERLEREIDWFERNRVDYVLCADANFGIKERDVEIARAVARAKARSGAPRKFRVFSTKNASARVLDVVDVLHAAGLDQGLSLTMQTLGDQTLRAIGRKNIKLDTYVTLARAARDRGMVSYSDLIVGLPGETRESFIAGLDVLLGLGQHDNVHVYVCTLLQGSEMADPEYRARHGLVTVKAPIIERHMRADAIPGAGIQELEEVVIGTATMPTVDWIETNVFTVLLNVLHYQKVAPLVALYLFHTHGVPYRAWYERVREASRHADQWPALAHAAEFAQAFFESISRGQTERLVLQEYGDVVWPIEEAVFLRASSDFSRLLAELERLASLLLRERGVDVDVDELAELVLVQGALLPRPAGPATRELRLARDWPRWMAGALASRAEPLVTRPTHVSIRDQHGAFSGLPDYARRIAWYARSAADIPYRLEVMAPPTPGNTS